MLVGGMDAEVDTLVGGMDEEVDILVDGTFEGIGRMQDGSSDEPTVLITEPPMRFCASIIEKVTEVLAVMLAIQLKVSPTGGWRRKDSPCGTATCRAAKFNL